MLTSARPRQRDGQTDRKRESSREFLRTDGELGQSAAQPLRDCLQLFQLRLLTPALLTQDLVLQPLVTLSNTRHTCSKTRPRSHTAGSAGPVFKHVAVSCCRHLGQGNMPELRFLKYLLFAHCYRKVNNIRGSHLRLNGLRLQFTWSISIYAQLGKNSNVYKV